MIRRRRALAALVGAAMPAVADRSAAQSSSALVAAVPFDDFHAAGVALPGVDESPTGDPHDFGAVERSEIFADGFDEGSTFRWSRVGSSRPSSGQGPTHRSEVPASNPSQKRQGSPT